MARHVDLVRERFGEEVLQSLLARWAEACPRGAERLKLDYFLKLGEPAPCCFGCVEALPGRSTSVPVILQGQSQRSGYQQILDMMKPFLEMMCGAGRTDAASARHAEDHMHEHLAKMVLCAPETWFEVITGATLPSDATNDFTAIGVAFDSSSRLRRAGVEYYHDRLWEKHRKDGCLYVASLETPPSLELRSLHALPGAACPSVRMVAVSDTHLLHEKFGSLPEGDLLVHAGDLSFEESRSKDATECAEKLKEFSGDFKAFLRWFRSSSMGLTSAMKWLGSVSKFEHRVLVGGNHDYILEQLGHARAQELCQDFGVEYLHTAAPPLELPFSTGRSLRIWGSGISFYSTLGAGRQVLSGNRAYQMDSASGEAQFLEETSHLQPGSVDVLITHSPPAGALFGKRDQPRWINDLLKRIRPQVYLCGHAHNPEKLDINQKVADVEGTFGAQLANTSVWNSYVGLPFVFDLPKFQ